jgi:hypothetical protein
MLAGLSSSTGRGTVMGVIGGYQQGGRTSSVFYPCPVSASIAALCQAAIKA